MKKVFLIHGWEGRAEGGWRPWLKKELESRGFEVVVPQMPNTNEPQLSEWLAHLQKIANNPDEQTYFVGHSLGCITILRYIENLSENKKIGGAVLVAGFSGSIGVGYEKLDSFVSVPVNFEKIKKHTDKFIAIHSDNDPYVPLKMGEILQEKLGAKLVIEKGQGHFGGSEGNRGLPIALKSVLEIANIVK